MSKTNLTTLTSIEKIKLFMGKNNWQSQDFDGKLYSIRVSDGPVGLRMPENPVTWDGEIRKSISYPCLASLSSTWNEELSRKMGAAIGSDCVDYDVDILLGPGVNIKRTPINGRNFEYFSEDPLLAGLLSKAYIEGLQSNHVGACLKHYCCNNREFARRFVDCRVSKRALMEIYLRPFKIAIEAKPWTIMNSYNKVNGTLMSENTELLSLLYDRFGFDGGIISDWESVHDPLKSFRAPMTLQMPYNKEHLDILLSNNDFKEEEIESKAKAILSLVEKCQSEKAMAKATLSIQERLQTSYEVALESFVLLKNDNALPLRKNSKVLVTGDPCFQYYAGGGSSHVNPSEEYEPLDQALRNEGIDASSFWHTVFYPRGDERSTGDFLGCINAAKGCDYVILGVGNHESAEGEERDRYDLKLTHEDLVLIDCLHKNGIKIILLVYAGGVVELDEVKDKVSAILLAGFGGQRVSKALSKVIKGEVSPSGRLAETYVKRLEYVKEQKIPFDGITFNYEEGIKVGYRGYSDDEVLYPFGYGLSYASFKYSNFDVAFDGNRVIASFALKNEGNIKAKEVAQIYFKNPACDLEMPETELAGFAKIELEPHQEKQVQIAIPLERFAHFDESKDDYSVTRGEFEIRLCQNASTIIDSKKVTINER